MDRIKMGYLVINGKVHPLFRGVNVIGRNKEAAVIIRDMAVSHHQALIIIKDEENIYLSDSKSSNGTFLENIKLVPFELYKINCGDSIKFSENVHTVFKQKQTSSSQTMTQTEVNCETQVDDTFFQLNTQNLLCPSQDFQHIPHSSTIRNECAIPDDGLDCSFATTQIEKEIENLSEEKSIHEMETQRIFESTASSKYETFHDLPTQIIEMAKGGDDISDIQNTVTVEAAILETRNPFSCKILQAENDIESDASDEFSITNQGTSKSLNLDESKNSNYIPETVENIEKDQTNKMENVKNDTDAQNKDEADFQNFDQSKNVISKKKATIERKKLDDSDAETDVEDDDEKNEEQKTGQKLPLQQNIDCENYSDLSDQKKEVQINLGEIKNNVDHNSDFGSNNQDKNVQCGLDEVKNDSDSGQNNQLSKVDTVLCNAKDEFNVDSDSNVRSTNHMKKVQTKLGIIKIVFCSDDNSSPTNKRRRIGDNSMDDTIEETFVEEKSFSNLSTDFIPATQDCQNLKVTDSSNVPPTTENLKQSNFSERSFSLQLSQIEELESSSENISNHNHLFKVPIPVPNSKTDKVNEAPMMDSVKITETVDDHLKMSRVNFDAPIQKLELTIDTNRNLAGPSGKVSKSPNYFSHQFKTVEFDAETQKFETKSNPVEKSTPKSQKAESADEPSKDDFSFTAPTQVLMIDTIHTIRKSPLVNRTNFSKSLDSDDDIFCQPTQQVTKEKNDFSDMPTQKLEVNDIDIETQKISEQKLVNAEEANEVLNHTSSSLESSEMDHFSEKQFSGSSNNSLPSVEKQIQNLLAQKVVSINLANPIPKTVTKPGEKNFSNIESQLEVIFETQTIQPHQLDDSRPKNPLSSFLQNISTQEVLNDLCGESGISIEKEEKIREIKTKKNVSTNKVDNIEEKICLENTKKSKDLEKKRKNETDSKRRKLRRHEEHPKQDIDEKKLSKQSNDNQNEENTKSIDSENLRKLRRNKEDTNIQKEQTKNSKQSSRNKNEEVTNQKIVESRASKRSNKNRIEEGTTENVEELVESEEELNQQINSEQSIRSKVEEDIKSIKTEYTRRKLRRNKEELIQQKEETRKPIRQSSRNKNQEEIKSIEVGRIRKNFKSNADTNQIEEPKIPKRTTRNKKEEDVKTIESQNIRSTENTNQQIEESKISKQNKNGENSKSTNFDNTKSNEEAIQLIQETINKIENKKTKVGGSEESTYQQTEVTRTTRQTSRNRISNNKETILRRGSRNSETDHDEDFEEELVLTKPKLRKRKSEGDTVMSKKLKSLGIVEEKTSIVVKMNKPLLKIHMKEDVEEQQTSSASEKISATFSKSALSGRSKSSNSSENKDLGKSGKDLMSVTKSRREQVLPTLEETFEDTHLLNVEKSNKRFKPKIVFTMLDSPMLCTLVRSLGGSLVDSVEASTVLVTKNVVRSLKLLQAVGQGKPICSPTWLTECKAAKTFLDPWSFIINDAEAEEKWKFNLKESLKRSQQKRLFADYKFILVVSTTADILKGAIESSGGKVVKGIGKLGTYIVIASPDNKKKCTKYMKDNITVATPEAVFDGVLRQEIVFHENLL